MQDEVVRAAGWLALALFVAAVWPERSPPPPDWGSAPEGAPGLLFGRPMDPNRASAEDLEVLPGIGPARAEAIVQERERGPFCSLLALRRVPGIGPVRLARIAPKLAVGPHPACPGPD